MKKKATLIALCALSLTMACVLAGCGASLDREITVEGMTLKVPSNWVETSDEETTSILALSRLEAPRALAAGNAVPKGAVTGTDAVETGAVAGATMGDPAGDDSEEAATTDESATGDVAPSDELAVTHGIDEVGADASQAIPDSPGDAASNGSAAASSVTPGGNVAYRDVDEDNEDEHNAITVSYLPLAKSPVKSAQEAIALKQLQAEREFGVINWDIDKEKSSVIDGAQVTKFEYSFEKEIDHVTKKYEYKTVYVFNAGMCYEVSVYGGAASLDDVVNSIEF